MVTRTDVALRRCPGEVFCSAETGGLCHDNDGALVEVSDVRRDPQRTFKDAQDFVDIDDIESDDELRAAADEACGEEELDPDSEKTPPSRDSCPRIRGLLKLIESPNHTNSCKNQARQELAKLLKR